MPLKLLTVGDFSNGKGQRPLSEREKIDVNKNNFDSVMAELAPSVSLSVKNTVRNDGSKEEVNLTFKSIKDFEPEQVARNIPHVRVLLSMRNLLRDLKSNLLDNSAFRRELEKILLDPALSDELRTELTAMMPAEQ